MGPRRQRVEAVSKLKDALTCQFGEHARSAVEAQVDAHVGTSKGNISRQHLDAIEQGIMATMRQTRGSTRKVGTLSRSAPTLPMASSPAASTQATAAAAFPPATPVMSMPKLPIGTSNPGALVRSASTGGLTTDAKSKQRRPAPYGQSSLTSGSQFVDESARSGVKVQPRYPVPLPPKLKPMDHWDLIVAFDSQKYREEERRLHQTGTYERKMKFKKVLDDQMLEIQAARDAEARGLEEERDMMTAQIEENKKYLKEEHEVIHRKKEEQSKINTSMLGEINKYRQRDQERKQRECEEMTRWLESEKQQREEDDRNMKIEYARKCEAAKKELDEACELRKERRRQEEANEIRLMKLRDQIADEQEAKKQKALQDRKDHIDKIAKTMGAAVAERDAQDQADLEAKIKRIQEESNRRSMEDARNRQNTHNAKVKDMVDTLKRQMEEKDRDDEEERQADIRRAEIYRQQVEDGKRDELAKIEKRRKDREELDKVLIGQIRVNAGIHPHHVMMTPRNRKTELGYNKAIFEQMTKEGFRADAVNTLMAKPGKDHHPEGKLLPFPTIPRYTGEIHPIELEPPDV